MQELAEKIDVTRQTALATEASKYSLSPEVAFLIADVLEMPLEKVLRYEASEPCEVLVPLQG